MRAGAGAYLVMFGIMVILIVLIMAFYPQYRVYSQRLAGEASLAEAQSSRQVAVLEARARRESAKELAAAEILRAEGAAKANAILQDSLGGPDGYLRYLQIQALESSRASLIYVPTESGLPITESARIRPGL
ncbi:MULTISPECIES: membrane protease subunit [unclassified Sphingorhabdus]|uniref:membrane protease subunit n=1 Tax=unclassified Sphingorhabdus TaxID=2614947 RepID=UPI001F0BE411|nr:MULTISPECIES: membrane protease subunit [unclassified Sphingorhabdus]